MTKKGSQSATKNFHVLIKFKDEVPGSVSRIRIASNGSRGATLRALLPRIRIQDWHQRPFYINLCKKVKRGKGSPKKNQFIWYNCTKLVKPTHPPHEKEKFGTYTKSHFHREFTIKGVNYAIKTEMQKVADVDDHDDDGHSHHVSIFCSQLGFAPSFNNFIALHLYVLYMYF